MKIKWYGHSCFMLTAENGACVLTDPCDPQTGYTLPKLKADCVTISHSHHDHSYVECLEKGAQIMDTASVQELRGIKISGYSTYHDTKKGALRGSNIMFLYNIDGMSVLHCGDIGEMPSDEVLSKIGAVDVLLVPIGGVYTIGEAEARELANRLRARVLIPMHYKTKQLTFELESSDAFISNAQGCSIHRLNQSEVTLGKDSLGEDRIIVLSV